MKIEVEVSEYLKMALLLERHANLHVAMKNVASDSEMDGWHKGRELTRLVDGFSGEISGELKSVMGWLDEAQETA
jgi:hypothetical protein